MNKETLHNILTMNIPLEELAIDLGIYEFYNDNNMGIGISYEMNKDNEPVYIFNLFVNNKYVDIDGEYKSIFDAEDILLETWNTFRKNMLDK